MISTSIPEDELHQAEYGDLLSQGSLVGDQGRHGIQSGRMSGAQAVVGAHVPCMEGLQHLAQPGVRRLIQHRHLHSTHTGAPHPLQAAATMPGAICRTAARAPTVAGCDTCP